MYQHFKVLTQEQFEICKDFLKEPSAHALRVGGDERGVLFEAPAGSGKTKVIAWLAVQSIYKNRSVEC